MVYFFIILTHFCIRCEEKKRENIEKNSLTPYTGVCGFFLSFELATSLLINNESIVFVMVFKF